MLKKLLPILALALFIFIVLISFSSVLASPGYSPLLDDPTPTPCTMAGDMLLDLDGSWADSDASGDNTYSDIIIDSSGSTGQFDINITYSGRSAKDWFGSPENEAANVYWQAFSGGQNVGDIQDPVDGYFTDNTVTIPHEQLQTDGALRVRFWFTAPAVSQHSYLTIDSIEFDGLVISAPCQDCFETPAAETDEVKTGTLLGTDEVGHIIELEIGETYLLYTEDGPWNDGTSDLYPIAIRTFDGTEWTEFVALADWDDEAATIEPPCNSDFLDSEDNEAVSFTASTDIQSINIRVNDTAAAFGDNSKSINYVLATTAPGYGQGCSAYWEKGDEILSTSVDSTQSVPWYFDENEKITQGAYGLVIDGTYLDGTASSNAVQVCNWPDSFGTDQYCYDDDNLWTGVDTCSAEYDEYREYYGDARITFYQPGYTFGFNEVRPLVGAVDSGDGYGNNSGTTDVSIYEVTYNAPPSDCGTTYDKGTYLETISIDAQSDIGKTFPLMYPKLEDNQYYYLEPKSPYSLNGTESYAFEIKPNAIGLGDWQDDDYYMDCVTQVDQDRYGYYFKTDIDLLPSLNEYDNEDFMWLRAESSGFPATREDNDGTLLVELWGAVSNVVPDGENCSDYYDTDTLVYMDEIDADITAGYSLDHSVFTPGEVYKIVTTDASNKGGEIRRAYSGQSPTPEYEDFETWGAGLCFDDTTGYDEVYFTAQALSDYEIRAEDADIATGTFSFEVYTTSTLKNPASGCEYRDYNDVDQWYIIRENADVMANISGEGDDITSAFLLANELWAGYRYKIETSGGPWTSSGAPYSGYGLQISENGGQTWIDLDDWLDCVVNVGDHIRGYKSDITTSGPFLLRVDDPEELWVNNNGYITVDFYTEYGGSVEDGLYDPWGAWGFGSGCTSNCQRPGSWLEVGGWIEYARCAIVKYFSWCPDQQDTVDKMKTKYYGVEPFQTIMEFIELGNMVKVEVDSYTLTDDEGGGEPAQIAAPSNFIFMPGNGAAGGVEVPLVGEDTIWGGGEITLTGPDGTSYETECDSLLADSLGPLLAQPVCFFFNVTDALGINTWFQLIWDLAMIGGLGLYINNSWIKKALT